MVVPYMAGIYTDPRTSLRAICRLPVPAGYGILSYPRDNNRRQDPVVS
jgi:hypothetical protein